MLKEKSGEAVTNQQFLEEANDYFEAGSPKTNYNDLSTLLSLIMGKCASKDWRSRKDAGRGRRAIILIRKNPTIRFSHSSGWVRLCYKCLTTPSRLAKTLNASRRNGNLMSGEKSDPEVTPADITSLGKWPAAEEAIRKLGRDHGVPAEDIESFLDAIKAARRRKEEHENRTHPFCKS